MALADAQISKSESDLPDASASVTQRGLRPRPPDQLSPFGPRYLPTAFGCAAAPLRLPVAAQIAFPDGSMSERGLKREIDRGRLAFERIAGKTYTTLRDIKRMRELCRENHWGSVNTSASETAGRLSGSSSMAEMKSAQDAARTTALQLIASSSHLPHFASDDLDGVAALFLLR